MPCDTSFLGHFALDIDSDGQLPYDVIKPDFGRESGQVRVKLGQIFKSKFLR